MSPLESILHLPTLLPQLREPVTLSIEPYTLYFRRPARTSRGEYRTKLVYILKLRSVANPHLIGYGECAPMPQLSCDDLPHYPTLLQQLAHTLAQDPHLLDPAMLRAYPSIAFGLATAISGLLATRRHHNFPTPPLCDTPFTRGEATITINGLIWMGEKNYMYRQIKEKIAQGFGCLKLKIGGIDFQEELRLLRYIRRNFTPQEIELRVDANGAFSSDTALEKLKQLSDLQLHSIEQPIPPSPHHWETLATLIEKTPLPIALDEELIPLHATESKIELLDQAKPHYLIIKPTLHSDPDEWIELANQHHIGWWATSALESNIGLAAIAQWVSQYPIQCPQGLGTGALYQNNTSSPLILQKDQLHYHSFPKN